MSAPTNTQLRDEILAAVNTLESKLTARIDGVETG